MLEYLGLHQVVVVRLIDHLKLGVFRIRVQSNWRQLSFKVCSMSNHPLIAMLEPLGVLLVPLCLPFDVLLHLVKF